MRIIDAHTHPIMFRRGGTPAEIARLVRHGKSVGIERMIALGDVLLHGRDFTAAQVRAVNDATARLLQRRPDYFIGFCFLNPKLGERAVMSEVERCVTRFGFRGLKLEICNNARDACMRPVMAAARRWKLIVLQHAWSQTNLRQRHYHSDPADVALLARRHPDVTVIMPHLTGIGVRGVLEAKPLPNLHLDTSGGPPEERLLEYAVEHLGVRRVLYGSDYPIRAPSVAIARVLGAPLSPAEQRQILFGNAARLFGAN
jgi:predicted TIM-barrel fold metal-dependent hydrolase